MESIRELIEAPPDVERTLRLYLRQHPEDAEGIERVLQFREKVSAEFERLVLQSESVPGEMRIEETQRVNLKTS